MVLGQKREVFWKCLKIKLVSSSEGYSETGNAIKNRLHCYKQIILLQSLHILQKMELISFLDSFSENVTFFSPNLSIKLALWLVFWTCFVSLAFSFVSFLICLMCTRSFTSNSVAKGWGKIDQK